MSSPAHPDDILQKISGPHGRWKTTTLGGLSNEAPHFACLIWCQCLASFFGERFVAEGSRGKSFALRVALVGHGGLLSTGRFAVVLVPSKCYWKARQKSSPALAVSDLGVLSEGSGIPHLGHLFCKDLSCLWKQCRGHGRCPGAPAMLEATDFAISTGVLFISSF